MTDIHFETMGEGEIPSCLIWLIDDYATDVAHNYQLSGALS